MCKLIKSNITFKENWADKDEVKREYNLALNNNVNYEEYEAVVLAVAHNKFKNIKIDNKEQVIYDIKSILDISDGK